MCDWILACKRWRRQGLALASWGVAGRTGWQDRQDGMDSGNVCAVVLLNHKAAFDTVDNQILLQMMNSRLPSKECCLIGASRSHWKDAFCKRMRCISLQQCRLITPRCVLWATWVLGSSEQCLTGALTNSLLISSAVYHIVPAFAWRATGDISAEVFSMSEPFVWRSFVETATSIRGQTTRWWWWWCMSHCRILTTPR